MGFNRITHCSLVCTITLNFVVLECELDYNRVMASKISKLVIPKSEIESSVVRTMLVEMLASCVLMPVMGCFVPDSVNGEFSVAYGFIVLKHN